ncbi:Aryl-alcohol dehydrogenase [Apiospora hydei]|uniref:Aryl-alcohol dehydrogenase n=1 Tax=Apiospora hydei TaxID=1337664 RepID=A0ABR1WWP7_9PEZI
MVPVQRSARDQRPQNVELQFMPPGVHMRQYGEDWTGITNQQERKKLQNRLNKRASRQRKKRAAPTDDPSDVTSTPSPRPDAANTSPLRSLMSTFSHCKREDIVQKRAMLARFAEQAIASYMMADPHADHRLKLIQLNTINGFTRNAAALGFSFDWLICELVSPFGLISQLSPPPAPSSLAPTSMQLSTRHHPWLDLFPFPKMRDNLLVATAVLSAEDEQRLFDDIMESGGGRSEWAGLVVWESPGTPKLGSEPALSAEVGMAD